MQGKPRFELKWSDNAQALFASDPAYRGGEVVTAELFEAAATRLATYEAALREIDRLGSLVAHDLQGRIQGGKLAAVARLPEIAREALEAK